jgi:uncharacterized protein YcnI
MSRTRVPVRVALALLVGATTTVLLPAPAQAHVSVFPAVAAAGGTSTLTFRVPNERADARTTGVRIVLPTTGTPITSVAVHQLAGWQATVEESTLTTPVAVGSATVTEALSAVVWTAADAEAAISGNQFQEFRVSLGPLPTDVDRVVFKALQTYSDGQVVRWIEDPPEGGPVPTNPSVVLRLSATATDSLDEHGLSHVGEASTGEPGRTDGVALAVAGAGVVLGAAALLLGLIGRSRAASRR